MHRLRGYLHAELDVGRLQGGDTVSGLGFRDRYVPEEVAPFDEVEFARRLDEDSDLVLSLAVENGRIERILIGWAPLGDDDEDVMALPEDQLSEALAEHGESIVALLGHLTGSPPGS